MALRRPRTLAAGAGRAAGAGLPGDAGAATPSVPVRGPSPSSWLLTTPPRLRVGPLPPCYACRTRGRGLAPCPGGVTYDTRGTGGEITVSPGTDFVRREIGRLPPGRRASSDRALRHIPSGARPT